jgi:O-antigen/teichoic acid export membrane protein
VIIRRLLRDGAIYGISKVLYSGLPILLTPLFARFLTRAEMGGYELLALLTVLANVVVALEVAQGFARSSVDAQTDDERGVIASSALLFSVACYAAFLLLCWLGARPLSAIVMGEAGWERAFVAGVVSCSASGIFAFFQQVLRWRLRPTAYTLSTLLYVVLTAALSLVLLLRERGVVAIFIAQTLSSLCATALAAYLGSDFFRARFSWFRCREMLAFSIPLVPSSLGVFVFNYCDRYLLQHYGGLADVGVYGVAFKYAGTAAFLLVAMFPALTPLIYNEHKDAGTPAALARTLQGFTGLTLPLLVLLGVFAREGLTLLGSADYAGAATVVPFLSASAVLARLYIFAPGLQLAKRTSLVAVVNVSAALLNIGLGVLWIPTLGILGAALATLVSSTAVCAALFALSHKLYPIPYPWPRIALGVALAAAAIALVGLSSAGLLARLAIAALACALITERLKVWEELRAFLRSR